MAAEVCRLPVAHTLATDAGPRLCRGSRPPTSYDRAAAPRRPDAGRAGRRADPGGGAGHRLGPRRPRPPPAGTRQPHRWRLAQPPGDALRGRIVRPDRLARVAGRGHPRGERVPAPSGTGGATRRPQQRRGAERGGGSCGAAPGVRGRPIDTDRGQRADGRRPRPAGRQRDRRPPRRGRRRGRAPLDGSRGPRAGAATAALTAWVLGFRLQLARVGALQPRRANDGAGGSPP